MPRPSDPPWIYHPNNVRWRVQTVEFRVMLFSAVSSLHSHLGENILVCTLFSNTLNLCSSLNVRDQVSCPYERRVKL
jgi:hypothetical protein